ncbi:MAG: FHA domain-containing protein [Bacillota bacterium]|nr:FHA domain-containing protein [Bacillota bacterium]
MYNSNNQQFVFKQNSGKVWNFYYDEKLGLCCCTLTKRNVWSEPVSLQKNIYRYFYIDIDSEDTFHVLYQDKQGNIFYSHLTGGTSIKTIAVLSSKSVSSYNKYFTLIPMRDTIHLFYVLNHNNSLMLAHQLIINDKVENPKVIDYVCNNSLPYTVNSDKAGNIYTFYQASDGKNYQIGYKKFLAPQKFWSEFTPITRNATNNEYPWTIIDSKSTIHICYQRYNDRQYELVYQQKVPDRNMWTNETVIHNSIHPFNEASIAYINEEIIIYWVRDDIIYYSSSSDYGITWSKPSRYNFSAGRQLVCIKYKTNSTFEIEKIISSHLPGSFINGFKIAFYSGLAETDIYNLSADELRYMIVDSFKLLRSSIEELHDSDSELRESISRIVSSQSELEKDIIKYTVKLGFIDSELKQLRHNLNKFEQYRDILEDLRIKNNAQLQEEDANMKDQTDAREEIIFAKDTIPDKNMSDLTKPEIFPDMEEVETDEKADIGQQPTI